MSDSKDDDDLTIDQRLAWLRERGVLVETPEERRVKAITTIMNETDETSDETGEVISFVWVPHDTAKPLQELTVALSASAPGDVLVQHLKPAFGGKEVDLTLFQKHAAHHLGSSASADDGGLPTTVSPDTLQQVAVQGNVETFTLLPATPSNSFTGINIYLDEVGMLKRLPLNTRASEYARRAGFNPPPQFYGDVFLGRVKTRPSLTNVSFRLGEDTAWDAPWLQKATMENLEYQTQLNQITGRTDTQKLTDGLDGVAKAEDGYTWTQTEEELEVVVPLPQNATSKDVLVKYHPQSLQVYCQKKLSLKLDLFERIDPDGCTWTIDRVGSDTKLVVTMEKVESASWPRILN